MVDAVELAQDNLSQGNGSSKQSIVKLGIQRVLSLAILGLLLATIAAGTGENIHSQLLKLGAFIWDDYFILRGEQPVADCDLNQDIDARLAELAEQHAQSDDDFGLMDSEFDFEGARGSLINQYEVCAKKHREASVYTLNLTPSIKVFRTIEHSFADLSLFAIAQQKMTLILLLVLAATVTAWKRHHIVFRSIKTKLDHYVSYSAQLLATSSLGVSAYAFYQGSYASGTEVAHPELMVILMLGGAVLSLISLYRLIRPEPGLIPGGKPVRALLAIPIHSYMLLVAAYQFFIKEAHLPGIAIYFTQIFQLTNLHLSVGLYILMGMLLKETLLGSKLFDVFKPWHLPPEITAFVAILLLAYPTAYTGASGIIIIAMGAVAYQELRRVGTRRQLALAITAMTGSSGVVLRPCLLVVGIAILNEEVVTDELYHWGFRVFLLTMAVFVIVAWVTRKESAPIVAPRAALLPSLKLLLPLLPYVLIVAALLAFYAIVLDDKLNEFSAPTILPIIVIALIVFERRFSKDFHQRNKIACASPTVSSAFVTAVDNSAVQIGAIIMLMACSFTVGGVLERGSGMLEIPAVFSSVYATMGFLVLFLVLIGMVMDPFGALILVTGTIAPVAYSQGINPIHFWMTCLIAFELGYLSPPVALNHLLTRQVVGDEEFELSLQEGGSFYYRHERIILPLLVMGSTLLIVAFVPLFIMNKG